MRRCAHGAIGNGPIAYSWTCCFRGDEVKRYFLATKNFRPELCQKKTAKLSSAEGSGKRRSFRYQAIRFWQYEAITKGPEFLLPFGAAHEVLQRLATMDAAIDPFAFLKNMASPENVARSLPNCDAFVLCHFSSRHEIRQRGRPGDSSLFRRLAKMVRGVQRQFTAEAESKFY